LFVLLSFFFPFTFLILHHSAQLVVCYSPSLIFMDFCILKEMADVLSKLGARGGTVG
jgi:hypothetical protein